MDASVLNAVLDTVALILVLVGAMLCLAAAVGVVRFRDVPTRLHAATKPQVLGLMLICLAIALALRSWPVTAFLVPVVVVQLATAPLAASVALSDASGRSMLKAWPEAVATPLRSSLKTWKRSCTGAAALSCTRSRRSRRSGLRKITVRVTSVTSGNTSA